MKNSIPFYDRLHFRVTTLLVIVALMIEIIIGFTAINLAKDKFYHTMQDGFHTTIVMAENFFSLVGQMGSIWSEHFVADSGLAYQQELTISNMPTDLVTHFKKESNADVIVILDGKGRVIVHSEKPDLKGESLMSWLMVRKALSSREVTVSIVQEINNLIIYSPNLVYKEGSDTIIGLMLIGYVLNDKLISGMKKDTLTDITIVRRRGVMASTYNTPKNRLIDIPLNYITYQSLLASKDGISNMRINEADYFVYARKLSQMDPAMDGSILLSYPQSELQIVIDDLITDILVISIISFTLILFIGWIFAERLVNPLRRLLVQTQQFEDTDTIEEIQLSARGEVAVLTQHFNTLLQSIKNKNKALRSHSAVLEETVKQRTHELMVSNKDLLEREKSLTNAQRIANLGSFDWFVDDDSVQCSMQVFHIMGIDKQDRPITFKELFECVHTDGLDAVQKMIDPYSNASANEIEFCVYRPDGRQRIVNLEVEVVSDNEGSPLKMSATIQDITERKQADENQLALQRQLQHTQKMEAIGQLTGGIAHDFNNLLAIIMVYTELARDGLRLHDNKKLESHLDQAYKSSEQAKELVAKMLEFSHGSKVKLEPLELSPLIYDAFEIIRSTLPSDIKIDLQIEENPLVIMTNAVQLQQVLMSLCINARDAMQGKGSIIIGLRYMNNVMTECSACHENLNDDYIQLYIRDTGHGIEMERLARIFDPFYTTKPLDSAKGTGMGLAIVHSIMSDHGGHVIVKNGPEKGVTFTLLFPVIEH